MESGVLALQGGYAAHVAALPGSREVRLAGEIEGLDLLVIPGGESTAMLRLLDTPEGEGVESAVRGLVARGGVVFGTCAGAILLAHAVTNPPQRSWDLIDVDLERNAYGRQLDSFTATLDPDHAAVFIRAPRIRRVGPGVEVLARHEGEPVLVRQRNVFAATFHPELTADRRIHRLVADAARTERRPAAR